MKPATGLPRGFGPDCSSPWGPSTRCRRVYFALRSDGLIKIGWSEMPARRCRELTNQHGMAVILLAAFPGEFRDEAKMHYRFERFRAEGEWYRLSDDLLEFIAAVAKTRW